MKLKSCIYAVVLTLVMAGSIASVALAASVSYNATPIANTLTDWSGTLNFQKFNQAGTLYKVDLLISAGITSSLTITNNGSSQSTGNGKTHLMVTVKDPLNLLLLTPEMYTSAVPYTLNPGNSITQNGLTANDTKFGSYTSSAILNEFTGSDFINLPTWTFTETVLANNGGNTLASQMTLANASGTVTYWYAPEVPEPSTIILAMLGMTGVGTFRRFRKQR